MKNQDNPDTEQSILEAAEKLFLEKGFAMTSTVEIAKNAGCNQALVHYYFRTKDKLFEAIFERKVKLFASSFFQIGNENIPFEEKLRRKIELHFDIIRANPKIPFLLFNEFTTNPQRVVAIKEKIGALPGTIFSQLKVELDAEIKKGTIRPIEPIDLLLMVISLNVLLFIAHPVLKALINISDEEFAKMVERRKVENVTVILKSLKP